MEYNYQRKLSKEEVLVVLDSCPAGRRSAIEEGLLTSASRFGFSFQSAQRLSLVGQYLLRHAFLVSDSSYDDKVVARAAELIENGFASIAVAFEYESHDSMLNARRHIDGAKARYGGRVNFLRPDSSDGERWWVSDSKIFDNSVCDTVRVKYIPKQIEDDDYAVSQEAKAFFVGVMQIIREKELFHRSETDGYIAYRDQCGTYITCTKTPKTEYRGDRISKILDYDEESNILSYIGNFLPSSDAVEAHIAFKHCPSVTAIVHTL